MRSGRQIWAIFSLCLLALGGALAWLSAETLEADRSRVEAQAHLLQEERARLALWRMDTLVGAALSAVDPGARGRLEPTLYLRAHAALGRGGLLVPRAVSDELPPDALAALDVDALLAKTEATAPTAKANNAASGALAQAGWVDQAQVAYDAPASTKNIADFSKRMVSSQRQYAQKRAPTRRPPPPPADRAPPTGASPEQAPFRPIWHEGELFLLWAEAVPGAPGPILSWVDRPRLEARLLEEAADLFPSLPTLVPAAGGADLGAGRRLATLPIELRLPPPPAPRASLGRWLVLALVWGVGLLAALAAALLLRGVLALSERRAAFVSSVTHELRTPLTTFQMYTEMLEAGMVEGEERKRHYLSTLRRESRRLNALVENVLAYAQIERGRRPTLEVVDLEALLEGARARLEARAAEGGLRFELSVKGPLPQVWADPTATEQIVFNLVDNAAKYAASAEDPALTLRVAPEAGGALLILRDHGPGVSRAEGKAIFEPFVKARAHVAGTAPGVGLGLALSARLAAAMGARLFLVGVEGPGAAFALRLAPLPPRLQAVEARGAA